ncbi:MAG: glycosyltransferase [Chlamydiae bacterium]|nr:glycosyltransferase [Chlamydiota bacterium]MBI3266345.1 glycosyltransferase [Chlamydiota bacterium]
MKESLSIILPTYNERETICRLIQKILEVISSMKWDAQVIVVDDSSPDGTAQTIKKTFYENPAVQLIVRKNNPSLGASVGEGIRAASKDYVLIMDADFNHSPSDIPRLWSCIERATLVNGSRFVRGGGMEKARLRYLGSRVFNLICRVILGLHVTDILSGFLLVRRKDLLSLDLNKIFVGYGDFSIRLHYAAKKKKWSVVEIPVHYPQRFGGRSKTRFCKHACQYLGAALKARLFL